MSHPEILCFSLTPNVMGRTKLTLSHAFSVEGPRELQRHIKNIAVRTKLKMVMPRRR